MPLVLAAVLLLSGCAPHALGLENDDDIRQSIVPDNGQGWGSVDLQNVTGSAIRMQGLHLTGLENARVSGVQVIRIAHGESIAFSSPPLDSALRRAFASAHQLRGFTVPAHSHDVFEAVFLLSAVDRSKDASAATVVLDYTSGGSRWSEVRHSAYCLAVDAGNRCGY